MTRHYGFICGLRPEKAQEYLELHETVWPGVLAMLRDCHISNYTIWKFDNVLVSTFDYDGKDFEADMNRMAGDEITKRWWAMTAPCQRPLTNSILAQNNPWSAMQEVFHFEGR